MDRDDADAGLIRAAARNHRSWFRSGGSTVRTRGLSWIAPPRRGEAVLPFPRGASRPALDAVLDWCREQDLAGIGCWATGLEPTTELADSAPRTWRAVAREDGEPVGQAWAHLTGGRLGSAGVYDVEVRPERRRRGLGRALTLAVCGAAATAGARVATLNATGEGELLYGALGFRSLGLGQTWWIHRNGLRQRPEPALVAVAEAAGWLAARGAPATRAADA